MTVNEKASQGTLLWENVEEKGYTDNDQLRQLRCVIDEDVPSCRRCKARGDEALCKFKVPLHDEMWQAGVDERISSLSKTVSSHHYRAIRYIVDEFI
jgi:hypothetical protein